MAKCKISNFNISLLVGAEVKYGHLWSLPISISFIVSQEIKEKFFESSCFFLKSEVEVLTVEVIETVIERAELWSNIMS